MDANDDTLLRPRIRVMQIIAGAIITGLTGFLVVAILCRGQFGGGQGLGAIAGIPLLTALSLGMLIVETPIAFVVPRNLLEKSMRSITAQAQPEAEASQLLAVRQTTMIITMALFEGVGFLACIATLLEGHILAVSVAVICIAIMITNFPTEGRLRYWLDEQQRRLSEARL